ncbi:adenylate/guanylate cyclase domain-containing protein [Phyllobacterium pellucidum]|uniref:adenylate/guanylate cyclase domain-containing protein n=1 Tax=Phyllobacterium pellucidum TaxID=2740464 RepID=UPI0031B601D9
MTTAAGPLRRSLFRKYFTTIFAAVLLPIIVGGTIEAWLGYRDQRASIDSRLLSEARASSERISSFLNSIIDQMGWAVQLPVASVSPEERRFDALRLLRQAPAITEFAQADRQGKELLRVSRIVPDIMDSGRDLSREASFQELMENGSRFGSVHFSRGSEPYMAIAIAGEKSSTGVAIAEVNLKLIWSVIANIRVGQKGHAHVRDRIGRLIAHPEIVRVLRGEDPGDLMAVPERPAVADDITQVPVGSNPVIVRRGDSGAWVIAGSAIVPGPNWTVYVEQPLSEAFAPIYAALWRTGILLIAGIAVSAALAYVLAGRITGPIRLLEQGATKIGAGQFDHRVRIDSGDELQELAERFNTMADEIALSKERSERIARLRQFLAPQVAELIEIEGSEKLLESKQADVVVVFGDLRNFTAFSAKAEPGEIMAVLEEFFTVLGQLVQKHEATQTGFSGDGFMLLLNAPVPCDDPVGLAARMAVDIQEAVQELVFRWTSVGYGIGFGMGMAAGAATVGRIGYEGRLEYTAIGPVVNLASRLCSAAKDGQILIDAATARQIGPAFPLDDLGERLLKGFEADTRVFAIKMKEGRVCE